MVDNFQVRWTLGSLPTAMPEFVIDADAVWATGKLLRIEVKSTARPRLSDAACLRTFRAEYGKKARTELLLHTGNAIGWLAPRCAGCTLVDGSVAFGVRHLSPSIAPRRHFVAVEVTVKLARADSKLPVFKCLQVPATIECE